MCPWWMRGTFRREGRDVSRTIIRIDEDLCNGCGACALACHEGAIAMVNGKARLVREDYCDGLVDCLPACPVGAISFVEANGAPAVPVGPSAPTSVSAVSGGCPSAAPLVFGQWQAGGNSQASLSSQIDGGPRAGLAPRADGMRDSDVSRPRHGSALAQWPCQIRLVPTNAPFFAGADVLIAADCTAFACATLHDGLMTGRVTLIGCPKLDATDYAVKLGEILRANDVRSLTVARMDVPCCGGLVSAVGRAIAASGKDVPLSVVVIGRDGSVAR